MFDLHVSWWCFSKSLPWLVKHFNHHFPLWFHALVGIYYTIFCHTPSLVSWSVTLCVVNVASVTKWWDLSQIMYSPSNIFGTSLKKRKKTFLESILKSLSKTLFCKTNTTFIRKICASNLLHNYWLVLPALLLPGKSVLVLFKQLFPKWRRIFPY